jgi:selT/selW/selH-like putative selenoprotein
VRSRFVTYRDAFAPTYPTWRGLEFGSVTLTPDATGGVFEVRVDHELVWSRKEQGRFPEIRSSSSPCTTASSPVGRSDIPTQGDVSGRP